MLTQCKFQQLCFNYYIPPFGDPMIVLFCSVPQNTVRLHKTPPQKWSFYNCETKYICKDKNTMELDVFLACLFMTSKSFDVAENWAISM